MKNKKYQKKKTIRTVPQINQKIAETDKIDTPISWFDTVILVKVWCVKQV
jgi:hypothetical protein